MRRGSRHTKDTIKKMKIAREKQIPPMLGKHHSEESKEKSRIAHLRENLSDETIEKNRIAHLKENLSNETIEKMRLAHLGKHMSLQTEFKKGQIPWNRGISHSQKTKEKISNANKGKKRSEEFRLMIIKRFAGSHHSKKTKLKMSKSAMGKNNSSWQGGLSFEPYSPEFNRQLKELIRQRDGYKCQLCGMPECENISKLTIHHIDYVKKNCLPDNLITLCRSCNAKVNFDRDYWEEYFKEKILEKVK